jgi:hypothetical protein
MTLCRVDQALLGRDKLGSERLHAPIDRDELIGRIKEKKRSPANLSKGLDQRLGPARRVGLRQERIGGGGHDPRQRVVVKLHFFGHGGGGAAALKGHARYIGREDASARALDETPARRDEDRARAHAGYLERDEPGHGFYDALTEEVDGAARMAVWAREDERHFRLIIAAENGADLKDLKPFVRDVMDDAERAMGTRLEWVAIDHYDTGQPHTHVVLRGRRANGRPLIIPKDYVKHGFREAARTIATQRLGKRTREDERRALDREARAHRPTRLDRTIEARLGARTELKVSELARRGDDPNLVRALKTRARELMRLGLATEVRRNVLSMNPAWRERLAAMEMHLDIRKSLMRAQAPKPKSPAPTDALKGLLR